MTRTVPETIAAQAPVVVGYDGSDDARAAVTWAAAEAARRGAPLVICTAAEGLEAARVAALSPEAMVAMSAFLDEDADDGALEALAADVRAEHPGLEVRVERVWSRATEALLAHTDAGLLVVGSTGKGLARSVILGTTSLTVVSHAHVPVVVVNHQTDPARESTGLVVVGVDGSADSSSAATAALAEAALRDGQVLALNTWSLEVVGGYVVTEPDSPEWQQLEEDRTRLVMRALAEARTLHPEVEVSVEVRKSSPARALAEASEAADLVVVGSRGLGGVKGQLLGSVSQRVLRESRAPVMVVRHQG